MVLRLHNLPLDREWLCVGLIDFASEVYDCCLLDVECRTTPCLSVQGVPNDGFDAFPVALRRRSRDPRRKVIHKGYRTTTAVGSSLYEVCVEEEK